MASCNTRTIEFWSDNMPDIRGTRSCVADGCGDQGLISPACIFTGLLFRPRQDRDDIGLNDVNFGYPAPPSSAERGSWWSQAEDLEQFGVQLGLERVVLVAHSAGTRLAIAYAAQFPLRVAALVLITPPSACLVDALTDTGTLIAKRRGDCDFDSVQCCCSKRMLISCMIAVAWPI